MPMEFKKLGISFQYPDNWSLDEEDAVAGRHSVTVYSPGGAFWSVSAHPPTMSPLELAQAAVKAMHGEYESLETEEVQEVIGGRELTGYDLNFFYLDLTNTATVRCLKTEAATYAVFCQAEDHEYDQIHQVFLAMTLTFLGGLNGQGERE